MFLSGLSTLRRLSSSCWRCRRRGVMCSLGHELRSVLILDGVGDAAEDRRNISNDAGAVDEQGGHDLAAKSAASARSLLDGQSDDQAGKHGEHRKRPSGGACGEKPEDCKDRRRDQPQDRSAPAPSWPRVPLLDVAGAVRAHEQAAQGEELGRNRDEAQAASTGKLAGRGFRFVRAWMLVVCAQMGLGGSPPSLPV